VTKVSPAALFVVAAWGVSFVATRIALEAFTPFAIVALRLTLGGALLLAVARRGRVRALPGREAAGVTLLLGVIVAAHLLIQAIGLEHTTAMNTAWIIGFIPVVIALGARIFLGQRLPRLAWAGIVVATIGVLLVTAHDPPDFERARLGDLLQVGSCFTWAAYTLVAVRPLQRYGSLSMTAGPIAVAAAVLWLATAVDGRLLVGVPDPASLGSVLFLGLVCSGVAYLLWMRAVAEIGPARTGVYLYVEPFVTLAVAWSVLGEPVMANAVAGGIAVLVGVALVHRAGRERRSGS
jgi:drug/metabolite transporter (DMT)-like permease